MTATQSGPLANNQDTDSRKMLLLRLEHDEQIAKSLADFSPVQRGSTLEQDDSVLGGMPSRS